METSQFWGSGYLSYPFIFIFFLNFYWFTKWWFNKKRIQIKEDFNFLFTLTCNFNIKINVYMAFRATLVLNNRYINFLVVYVLGAW